MGRNKGSGKGATFANGGRKYRKCRWCGEPKFRTAAHSVLGECPLTGGQTKVVCRNLDCPRRGQLRWQVPKCIKSRDLPEQDLSFDNVVRALEDWL